MPRKAREISETGIYHILLRAANNEIIFKDDEDKQEFIKITFRKREHDHFSLYAYCVLDNHAHLAVKDNSGNISSCIKGISIAYVWYYNKKYGKNGHLFYDRFKSEAINTENQLLSLTRFIHKNPVKMNMVKKPGDYEWSSYNLYVSEYENIYGSESVEKDTNEILSIFSTDKKTAEKMFKEYTISEGEDIFCEYGVLDKEIEMLKNKNIAIEIATKAGMQDDSLEIDRETLRDIILKLRNEHNISLRQIAEILKINRGLVQRLSAP